MRVVYNSWFFDILDRIQSVIDFINDIGGFTIIVWYKHGIINDRSLISDKDNNIYNTKDQEVQVVSNEINVHIVELQPTNCDMLSNG